MSKKILIPISILAIIALPILGACAPQAAPIEDAAPEVLELEDGLGRIVSIELPVERIISLAPSNTEILFAVGAGEQVIGRDSVSNYPEQAMQVTDIGGGWGDLNTETILTMDSDLVLAAELTAPEQIQTLEDLGLTVYALANPVDQEGLFENLRIVAQITGHEDEAETLIAELRGRVDVVLAKVATVEERPLVFYELDATDPNAPWTAGPGTFHDALINLAGGANVGSVLEGAWVQINLEELIAQDPEIILLGDNFYGGVTPEDVASRAGWDSLSAVQKGQIYIFNDDLISRPGPRLVDGLEELAKFLHPELFEE